MSRVMLTVKMAPERATVAHVREELGLGPEEIDADFGVVEIDPRDDLYAVLVGEGVAAKVQGVDYVEGPFSNPKIEPFGTTR